MLKSLIINHFLYYSINKQIEFFYTYKPQLFLLPVICGLISKPGGILNAFSGNKKIQYAEEVITETTDQEQEDNINNFKTIIHLLNDKINILNQQINIKKIKKLKNNILQLKEKIKEFEKTWYQEKGWGL